MSDEQTKVIAELDAQLKRISADVDHMLAKLDGIDALLSEALALVEGREVKDNCEVCGGAHGGVKGNENVIDGVVMCDYCHALAIERERQLRKALDPERCNERLEFGINRAYHCKLPKGHTGNHARTDGSYHVD